MITLGLYSNIGNHPTLISCDAIEQIESTPANSVVILPFNNKDLPIYEKNNQHLAIKVTSILEFILVAKCNVKYAISEYSLAVKLQKITENYFYDTKVLGTIIDESEIEKAALDELDGVYYSKYIRKLLDLH
jgi:hypothetical protein